MRTVDEAIVLAGGMGTRLRSVVSDLPKPMAPVAGRPFLAWLLDGLAEQGVSRTILATGYLGDQIETAIGSRWQGMDVAYSREDRPLGTGGAIRRAARQLRGDAVHVLNGDTYLHYSLTELEAATRAAAGARIGVALARVPDVARYGAVRLDEGFIAEFCEKGGSGPGAVNAGCYFLAPTALASLPQLESFSFETEVLLPLASNHRLLGYDRTSRFIDIGVPEDYFRAQAQFSAPPA